MATEILTRYGTTISGLTLIPSGGGVFEVRKDAELVFSKKATGRFPELSEIFALL